MANDHYQKFLIWSAYVRPYGLPPGGKMSTEFDAAAAPGCSDNAEEKISMIDIRDVTIRLAVIIRFNLLHHNLIGHIQKDYVYLYL